MTVTMPRPTLTPAERLRVARRARDLKAGRVKIPPACPKCFSPSIETITEKEDRGKIRCMTCGEVSKPAIVKTVRQQRLRAYLLDGRGVNVK